MNPYLIITGLCCSIIVSGLIPLFASPKVLVENKMQTQTKKDWGKHNSFQLRLKREEQLRQIEEMKSKIGQKRKKQLKQIEKKKSKIGQKRKTKKSRKTKKKITKKGKSKSKNKSKRK